MYINSQNQEVDVTSLETTHIINALNKAYREIWGSKNADEYNKYMSNINVLTNELTVRLDSFVDKKIESEWN